ncbi:MAG: hypothetical protein ABI650_01005 [Dokdonella sp.]
MAYKWLRLKVPAEYASAAADRVAHTLRDTGTAVLHQRDAGLDLARTLSHDVLASSREVGRSARQIVQQRPAETVLLVAAGAFAIGWIVRRLQESRSAHAATPVRRSVPARKSASRASK